MTARDWAESILAELDRAQRCFPAFHSAHEGYGVLLEEVDELWDAIRANDRGAHGMDKEAVQVAAMALRFLVDSAGWGA